MIEAAPRRHGYEIKPGELWLILIPSGKPRIGDWPTVVKIAAVEGERVDVDFLEPDAWNLSTHRSVDLLVVPLRHSHLHALCYGVVEYDQAVRKGKLMSPAGWMCWKERAKY